MCRTQCVLGLLVLYVALVHSWDVAVSHGDLLEFYTNDTKTDTVRFNSHKLAALAYDESHNSILYVDKQTNNDTICGHDISSKVNQCFIERNGRNIHGLAFDPATELVFFTDTNERSINWFSLKSESNTYGNLLMKLDNGIPTDIAVDSCRGFVYWINTNLTTPTIERSRFNGSEREVIININSVTTNTTFKMEPNSLNIDQQTRRLYWMEPSSVSKYIIYYTDLNGKNKTKLSYHNIHLLLTNPTSNILTVSKTTLFRADWCSNCNLQVAKLGKNKWTGAKYIELLIKNTTVGVAANYKSKEKIQDINDCAALTSLERKNSDGPFCVHGMKVIGQSKCKCAPGYIGERCDLSVCENYCLQGNCSVNDEGLPKCRCNGAFTGERCEIDACHGYCSNNGDCSLNEKSEPVCQCKGDHKGVRCEVSDCLNYCVQGNCSINDEGLPTCRCNAGYTGDRCEVNACHGYCLNNGDCSLNEKSEPVCQCKGDHKGVRCEVSDCLNYCMQGNCSFNDERLPTCRCHTGYSGERCEVNSCHGFCLNNGVCFLNEEDEPSCECGGGYQGSRCEAVQDGIATSTSSPTNSVGLKLTLADLLSKWRKPTAKYIIIADEP